MTKTLPKLIQYRKLILVVFACLMLLSLWKIPDMRANYNSEDYFPSKDELVTRYQQFDEDFVNEADYLLVAFENNPDVFEPLFVKQLDSFSSLVLRDTCIRRITGIHNYKDVRKTPFGLFQYSVLSSENPNGDNVRLRLHEDPRTQNFLINSDGTSTCLLLQIIKSVSDASANSLIDTILQSAAEVGLSRPKIGGRLYTETSYVKQLEKENYKLTPIFILVVSIVLLLLYRSVIASLLPTVSVIAGLVILYGYAAWIGRDINIATLMFPTVMAVVGITDLIHLYTKYQDELEKGFEKIQAIKSSIMELRTTLFLTSLTTMIGFLCVSFSKIPYVHTFGIDSAVGVGIAFLIAICLTPILLYYIPVRLIKLRKIKWDGLLNWIYEFTKRNGTPIIWSYFIIVLIGLYGITKVSMNNKLLDAVGDNSNLKQEFVYLEEEFAGVRTLELLIEMDEGQQIDQLPTLQSIDKIETYLRDLPAIGFVISPTAYYKSLEDASNGPPLSHYILPTDSLGLKKLIKMDPPFRNPLVSKDMTKGLISARMKDVGRLEMNEILTNLDTWLDQNLTEVNFKILPTGRHGLIDKTNDLMVGSLFEGLAIALLLISFIIFFLFKSLKITVISLIPNLLPLIMTAGTMGYLGVELNGSSAIIFTIAFVIAVDDTIHFLKKYAYLKTTEKDTNKEHLIHQTLLQAGKAILVTSIILISGYSILLLSEFKEAYYHGVLISFTLVWAILSDLILLPILMRRYA